jgi:hypothetical protein
MKRKTILFKEVKVYGEGSLYFERLLPKGWLLCDYDKDESLLEIEFEDGGGGWVDSEEICHVKIGDELSLYFGYEDILPVEVPGEVIVGVTNERKVIISHFSVDERRKRQYLMVFFDFVDAVERESFDDEDLPF